MRLLLCDRHQLFAESLGHVLRARGDAVRLVVSPEDAVRTVAIEPVDACLMELDFGGERVASAIGAMRDSRPSTRIVILTSIDDPRVLTPVLAAGVSGVLSKDHGLDHVLHTLPALIARSSAFDGPARHAFPPSRPRGPRFDPPAIADLTPREREVLDRLVMGEGTATLAAKLGVTYSTARTHVQNVLAKLGVHSRLEAVAAVYYSLDRAEVERVANRQSDRVEEADRAAGSSTSA